MTDEVVSIGRQVLDGIFPCQRLTTAAAGDFADQCAMFLTGARQHLAKVIEHPHRARSRGDPIDFTRSVTKEHFDPGAKRRSLEKILNSFEAIDREGQS